MQQIDAPVVYLVAQPDIDYDEIRWFLEEEGASEEYVQKWTDLLRREIPGGQDLIEVAGRMCYRSYEPGMNPNVTRVRGNQGDYLRNILASGHGSILEHVSLSFILSGVSRVLTHELVRHRAGSAFSQESLRYVRLDDIPVWVPGEGEADHAEFAADVREVTELAEAKIAKWAGKWGLDDRLTTFGYKKQMTSRLRRMAPEGLATNILWTANVRTLRHVIEMRTDPSAEEEMRLVFGMVLRHCRDTYPELFADFSQREPGAGWVPTYRKV